MARSIKDRRVKGCPNQGCTEYKTRKYKTDDVYCVKCGWQLVYVCAECFGPLEDSPDMHRLCKRCQIAEAKTSAIKKVAIKTEKGIANTAKKSSKAVGKVAKASVKVAKDTAPKVAKVVKEETPKVIAKVKKAATNPVVSELALDAADYVKDGIKSKKVKQVVDTTINNMKKINKKESK